MKISFLIKDLSSGGTQRAAVSLANYFSLHGHDAEIIAFHGDESFYPLEELVKVRSADFDDIKQNASLGRVLGAVKRILRIRKLVKSENPDVLIGMSFSMTWYAVLASAFTRTKCVGTERSNPYSYKASKLNTFLRKFFYRFTDGYIFQTEKAANFFRSKASHKDAVIPNAIFNETVYTLSPPAERKKVICAAGRLIRLKRFDILIDAFAEIADRIPDYRLFIFGEGEEKSELENQIKYLGLSDRVILAGADPNAVKFINYACAFVLSSDLEGMPNALLEAMAMGVPCISTRCELGPEELIENGVNGILTDVGNTEQLSNAMLTIIENPDIAQKLSQNGRKLIKSHSIENISNQWLEFLRKI